MPRMKRLSPRLRADLAIATTGAVYAYFQVKNVVFKNSHNALINIEDPP